jgi:hypothetical protein
VARTGTSCIYGAANGSFNEWNQLPLLEGNYQHRKSILLGRGDYHIASVEANFSEPQIPYRLLRHGYIWQFGKAGGFESAQNDVESTTKWNRLEYH